MNEKKAERTVTGDHQELVIVRKVVYHDVGVSCHDLLLGSKLGALLKLEVADGSGESEVAVHPSEVDETTGCGDSCFLTWEQRGQKTMCVCGAARCGQEFSTPSFWGLWSKESGFARPLTPKTLLESPALACRACQVSLKNPGRKSGRTVRTT